MTQKKHRQLLIFSLLGVIFGGLVIITHPSATAIAQQPTPSDDEVNAIANQLFCPVCENIPLDVCDTEACRQWRDLIRQMLAEGKSEEEIMQYFSENYGVRVLAEPPAEGFNWLAYIVPLIAFLFGASLLIRAFRIWKQQANDDSLASDFDNKSSTIENNYVSRVEEELKKRD